MVRPLVTLSFAVAALIARSGFAGPRSNPIGLRRSIADARAEACAPGVVLAGDAEVTGSIGELLAARDIATAATECGAVHATVTRRDDQLVVDVEQNGTTIQRVVGDAQTAATVIESFAQPALGDPLLASRPVPSEPVADIHEQASDAAATAPLSRSSRGVQVFSAFETSYASDHTSWVGAHLGVCIMLGPICAAARLRFGSVAAGSETWDMVERRGTELLVGIDIPFAVGAVTLSPGFAAGLGHLTTRGATHDTRIETGGLRADVHATLSIPLGKRFALDVFSAVDLTQETHIEQATVMVPLPDEPRALLRLGLGLRYGGM